MDERASPFYDPSNCPTRISIRTARAMINWKNICNRLSHDDRDLQPKSPTDSGQARKRLYMKGR